jgi:hypothetical protein
MVYHGLSRFINVYQVLSISINVCNKLLRTTEKTVNIFLPLFYFVMQVLCKTKNAPKGGFLGHTIFIYKMFRKSLTCADFKVIISRVIRA